MKPRTEELLYLLLWQVDQLMHPTFRNLTDSFEAWAYRNGFLRQLHDLEARQLIERQPGVAAAKAVYRLSERGRLIALGGRDPAAQWGRPWDGQWRMVLFDLPDTEATARVRLRRILRAYCFGYLQHSVWISPDPLSHITRKLSRHAADVESILTLEARPAAGENDADIVKGAWDFDRINERYKACLEVFRQRPTVTLKAGLSASHLRQWAQLERRTWQEAVSGDPLLPARLLPKGYLGTRAWEERIRALGSVSHLVC